MRENSPGRDPFDAPNAADPRVAVAARVCRRGGERASATAPADAAASFFVGSHEALFVEVPASHCDACGDALSEASDPEGRPGLDGYGIPGRGVYLWARGEETRLESVPLCASCASAIGMTALARWEIEEEEG